MKSFYSTNEWNEMRQAVFRRDNYTCQECNYTGSSKTVTFHDKLLGERSLVAHHKEARKDGGSDDLNNLITLCAPCHVQVEKRVKL